MLSFELGADVAFNSIFGLPTLRQWGGNLDFSTHAFAPTHINTRFPLNYEPTKQGLPPTVELSNRSFVRPYLASFFQASVMFANIDDHASLSTTEKCEIPVDNPSPIIVDSNAGSCFKCNTTTSHLL